MTDSVEDELAYGMESIGVAPAVMRRRVEETLDLLGLFDLRDRPLLSLSAGEQQRVAIGSVLTVHPAVLVLDEPTSALDPPAAEEVLAALTRLVHDLGLTVMVSEHRLERVVQHADRVLLLGPAGVVLGEPAEVLRDSPVAPPIVDLGRLAGWTPLPMSIRDARRASAALRASLDGARPDRRTGPPPGEPVGGDPRGWWWRTTAYRRCAGWTSTCTVARSSRSWGRNGAGKSTLLSALAGAGTRAMGTVNTVGRVGLIPQEPGDLLWAQSVATECVDADRDAHPARHDRHCSPTLPRTSSTTTTRATSPRASGCASCCLSSSRRARRCSLSTSRPAASTTRRSGGWSRSWRGWPAAGLPGVLVATHDVELVAEVADRLVILADGDIVSDGPARDVAVSSPVFAPQVAKVLAPLPMLTVADVRHALSGSTPSASTQ